LYRKDIYGAVLFNSLIENPLPINEYFKRFDCDLRLKSIAYKKIFILPGAGGDFKKWNIDNFIKVCESLGGNFYYVFVCGEREKKDLEVIDNFLSKHRGEILYNPEVDKLISYFHAGDLFISNDCGPSHIARMMLKPIITIYSNFYGDGEKVIKEWFLTYKNSHYLLGDQGKSINTVKIEDVIERVNKILN
ncbi:MAG TPA: glycosyltransferase family 9 protein, partial [Elusimicrobiales bacterium]|nr:glycosyltransferase family 9 protein [Elusimicrobiales bacterium]